VPSWKKGTFFLARRYYDESCFGSSLFIT